MQHGIFSRIDHILGHKSGIGEFKGNEIIPLMFSDHNAIRLDIYYREKKTIIENTNTWRLNNTLLNNQQITEEVKKCLEISDNENTTTQNLGCSKSSAKREVYSYVSLPQKIRET